MRCPFCGSENSKVIDKRNNKIKDSIRRRRECLDCQKRYTTYEKYDHFPFLIRKKSGKVEDYNRNKLKKSLLHGLKKRHVPDEKIEKLLDSIEITLIDSNKKIIETEDIGKEVLENLKEIDNVGYMLYAIVHKDFDSLVEIKKEIEKLM